MAEPIAILDSVTYSPHGRSLSLTLEPGDRYAVVGDRQSGIEEFFASLSPGTRPHSGTITLNEQLVDCALGRADKASTPGKIAKKLFSQTSTRSAGVLGSLDLWSQRDVSISKLTPEARAATEVLPGLACSRGLVAIHGQLDRLDLRTQDEICEEMASPEHAQKAFLIRTASPFLVERIGRVIVMRGGGAVFVGTIEEMIRTLAPVSVTASTTDPSAVAAMAEPFCFSTKLDRGVVTMEAHDAQALAAKLLVEGYGSVSTITYRQPTVAEALLSLV